MANFLELPEGQIINLDQVIAIIKRSEKGNLIFLMQGDLEYTTRLTREQLMRLMQQSGEVHKYWD